MATDLPSITNRVRELYGWTISTFREIDGVGFKDDPAYMFESHEAYDDWWISFDD